MRSPPVGTGAGDAPLHRPSVRELFIGFLKVGISGFGGVLPFARRMLVEERRWLNERDFIDVLSLCQFLPGPNIVNVSIVVGRRFHGPRGAIAASAGLMLLPFILIVALGALYRSAGEIAQVRAAFAGIASAAAGLVVAMGARMARPITGSSWQLAIAALAFAAIGWLRLPLVWVVLALVALALAFALRDTRAA
jgi:chromate transporter